MDDVEKERPVARAAERYTTRRDPVEAPEASPRFATPLALAAFVLGVVSVVGLLAPVTGPVGMATGLVAHVKGSRLGMPSAVFSGVCMIAGMALVMYLR